MGIRLLVGVAAVALLPWSAGAGRGAASGFLADQYKRSSFSQ